MTNGLPARAAAAPTRHKHGLRRSAAKSAYDTAEGDRPRHPDKSICVVCRSFKEIGVMQHTEYQARGCTYQERLALGASSPSVCEAPMSPCRGGA